ncbi:type II toxin-antitoxin system ParD family antitoxin [Flavihumibacter stibioxidans]|uniref:Antitoxin n=1 Tax=Flavihumibacter stibioxidans TaxID=1834163 RepID=A0ABR7MAH4_9BACT|nr:type II toxin-antitoxin system ParD family antitoxin [Flavihumibacter stibioxidans]MBC6492048.1 antitoxin [Flavihumibacter stibioxidans]
MGRNKSVSSGDYYEDFTESKISGGRFKNVSIVTRAGLGFLKEEEQRVIALRDPVQQGISSGIHPGFHPKKHLAKLKSLKKQNDLLQN